VRVEPVPERVPPLTGSDAGKAEALARYSQFLLLQEEQPDSIRLPDVLKKAAVADPSMAAFRLWLGQAYITRGRAAEAIPNLEESIRRFPDSDSLLFLLGIAYELTERTEEARVIYRKLIQRAPSQPDAYVRLAGLSLKADDADGAFSVLDEALRRVEEPIGILTLYEQLGDQYLKANKPWLAAICYSRIADRQPDNLPARERLMKSRLAAGDRTGAIRELEMLAARETRPEWRQLLGELHEEAGDAQAAAAWYQQAIDQGAPAEAWIRLGLLQARTNVAAGIETLQACTRQFQNDPQSAVATGALLLNAGRVKDALVEFESAEKRIQAMSPNSGLFISPLYFFWYGVACDQTGQPERAEKLFQDSIRLYPEVTEAFNYLAYNWAQRGVNLDEALALIKQALARKPDNPAYLDTLGWVLFRKGDFENALIHVKKAVDMDEDGEVAFHMGDILNALGRRDEAVSWWRRSLKLNPKGPAAERLKGAEGAP
jgi:tetratricopeptide (TPR) repeat protein